MLPNINKKFFDLPAARQNAILNGAMKAFAIFGYRKTSTEEIAGHAGISKALIFHYFKNKKTLYLFLYGYALNLMIQELQKGGGLRTDGGDLFDMLKQSQKIKVRAMEKHPYLFEFIAAAYYEEDPEIVTELGNQNNDLIGRSKANVLEKIDREKFRTDVDVPLLLDTIIWCADGMMRERMRSFDGNVQKIADDFNQVLDLLKTLTYKKEV
ncbi:TetR/AcrR family transcriptional regulator [Anaerolentibacter hominis]|uniref:TetR/AcrR family transcriptional regulator n=1 Tax=Anaerolentibacter hominis TaxID=3079009 RepID=UPI0031B81111